MADLTVAQLAAARQDFETRVATHIALEMNAFTRTTGMSIQGLSVQIIPILTIGREYPGSTLGQVQADLGSF